MINNDLLDRKKAAFIIQDMDSLQLKEYIKKRLKRISIIPTLSTHSDEAPEYFLEKVYEQSENPDFKLRFHDAIARLLTEEQIEISDAEYLASLFIFCERYIISEAVEPVGGMALSEKLKGMQSFYGDLHHRALMALSRMPQGLKMTDIWLNAAKDARYTSAAFAALRSQGLETILEYLPKFTQMYIKAPESINLEFAVKTLYEDFKDYPHDKITGLIERVVANENPQVKESVFTVLKSLGKQTLQPIPGTWNYVIPTTENVIMENLKSDLWRLSTQKKIEKESNVPHLLSLWKTYWEMKGKPEIAHKYANPANFVS